MNKNIEKISISNAKVHNLKSVSVDIPRDKLVVITGPSGSGKSSLAFDTLYIEGQRRYIESLSSYARQFLGQFQAPDVDSIVGLSPSIAIDQKSTTKNPRSTVGTITEIYDYLRILYSKAGTPHCPNCKQEIVSQSPQKIIESVMSHKLGSKIQILSPVLRGKKGEHKELLLKYQSLGFSRGRHNGSLVTLTDDLKLHKNKKNDFDIVVDRIILKKKKDSRVADSVEYALKMGQGSLVLIVDTKEFYFSEHSYCQKCDLNFPNLEPRSFSFNSPIGACTHCNGLGEQKEFDESEMIIDDRLSLIEGALKPLYKKNQFLLQMVKSIAKSENIDLNQPYKKLPKKFKKILFEGSDKIYKYSFSSENSNFDFKKKFPGMMEWLKKKYLESTSDKTRATMESYMKIKTCSHCQGNRLNSYASNVLIQKKSITEVCRLSLKESFTFFSDLKLYGEKKIIAEKVLLEINNRLSFLNDVGLGYLTINRSAISLSGGESQRIRLATQIGSALSGVLYVLDEPSIGLHQRDNKKLIQTLISLKDLGNTVIVVEHDEETIRNADFIIDMGPGAGLNGGEVVAKGSLNSILKSQKSPTGLYLSGKEKIEIPQNRRRLDQFVSIKSSNKNNIKNLDLNLPLEGFVCVTGVSGSGKSTLVHQVISPAIESLISKKPVYDYSFRSFKSVKSTHPIQSIIELNQTPLGRTPRSNPATYTGAFDEIRNLFSQTPESKIRGYKPGRFSFNVKGGRCEDCLGDGVKKIEMHFLPDVFVTCEVCKGKRYNQETLQITYKGKNISDVFGFTIDEAYDFFKNFPKLKKILSTLKAVGLGYMHLGQPSTTLSGGEAQRVKLSKELAKSPRGHCLYILDEPTTGLHFHDIKQLLASLNDLVKQGHSVLVIEHNLDVIKCADHVIDLGPEGGKEGGNIIAEGTPEEVAKSKKSYTGRYLKEIVGKS